MNFSDLRIDQLFFTRVFLFGLTGWATILTTLELIWDPFSPLWLGLLITAQGWLFCATLYQLQKQGWY